MRVTVCYVGSSLLAPLKSAERELNREYDLGLHVAPHNFGSPLAELEWQTVNNVMDGENAKRLIPALENYQKRHAAVNVIKCMAELMCRTRMGRSDIARL